ncbi:MAG TPA: hypothetical protein VHA73_05785 [Acidimicrobiales bacterium]|jgi:hypothetical protein|nr:hypothetical protein [Acidimicrobiales bacterium]
MRGLRRLALTSAAAIGAAVAFRWLRGPETAVFDEPWPVDVPWPAIELAEPAQGSAGAEPGSLSPG